MMAQSSCTFYEDFESGTCQQFPGCGEMVTDACLPGWNISHGVPSLTTNNPFAGQRSLRLAYFETVGHGQGVFLDFEFSEDVCYVISFEYLVTFGDGDFLMHLANNLTPFVPSTSDPNCNTLIPGLPSGQTIFDEVLFNTGEWATVEFSFTPAADFDHLLLYPYGSNDVTLQIDNFEISIDAGFDYEIMGCGAVDFYASCTTMSHHWDFDDGSTSTAASPSHTFTGGSYTVVYTVTGGGCTASETLELKIPASPNPGFTFEVPPLNCQDSPPVEVCFTSLDMGMGNLHLWDFGDGSPAGTAANPCHSYGSFGSFTVIHEVTNACTSAVETLIVELSGYDHVLGSLSPFGFYSLEEAIDDDPTLANFFGNTFAKKILIQGELDIDVADDVHNFYACTIDMDAGAGINVKDGKSLGISSSTIRGCENRWRSIEVLNEAKLILYNNLLISDGQYAVHMRIKGSLSCAENIFDKNYVSLYYNDPDGEFLLGPFFGNTMQCSGTLLPHYDTQDPNDGPWAFAGIQTIGQDFLSIGVAGANTNQFNALRNGILTQNCNLTLRNGQFNHILRQDYSLSGYGVHATGAGQVFLQDGDCFSANTVLFDNCQTGIYLEGMNANVCNNQMTSMGTGIQIRQGQNRDIEICGNVINANLHGISLWQNDPAERIQINDNEIKVTPFSPDIRAAAIFVRENGAEQPNARIEFHENINIFNAGAGISINGANGYAVEYNLIEAGAIGNLKYAGISLFNIQNSFLGCNFVNGDYETNSSGNINGPFGIRARASTNVLYECNDVQDTYLGVQFDMGCSDTDFRTTGFKNHRYGLHYTVTGVTGDQPASSTGDLHGNRWEGTWGGSSAVGARHENSDQNFVNESNFIVPSISAPEGPENPSSASSSWFDDDPNRDEYSCGTTCNVWVLQDPPVRELDHRIAKGLVDPGVNTNPMQWMLERDLYRKLYRQPDLLQGGTALDTFFTTKTSTTVGQFVEVESAIQSLFELDSISRQQLTAWRIALSEKIEAIAIIDSLLLTATGQDSLDLLVERLDTLVLLDSLSQLNAALVDSLLQYRAAQADTVIVQNNAISVSDDWEENEKGVNRIFLATLAKGILPDSTQLAQLQYIAGQCPYEGGTAVFRARAILSGLTEDVFDDESLCSPPDSEELLLPPGTEHQILASISVYPNPAKTMATINFSEIMDHPCDLLLTNLHGQIVMRYIVPENIKSFSFELPEDAVSGVYFLKVFGNGQQLNAFKIILSK